MKTGQAIATRELRLSDFDVANLGSKKTVLEEWAPHARMNEKTWEWWYMTCYVHDDTGNPYFVFLALPDHTGDVMQKRLLGRVLPEDQRVLGVTATITDYNADKLRMPMTLAVIHPDEMFDHSKNELTVTDNKETTVNWDFVGDTMRLKYKTPETEWDFMLTNASDALWHRDKHGFEGLIQQGTEDEWSFYYSIPNCHLSGRMILNNDDGTVEKDVQVSGRAWVDRQWGNFTTQFWEWASFRFSNGATMHLYNFYNGHQEGLYRSADGKVQYFDNVVVKQNGYQKAKIATSWVSWGWSYEFPIEIEGSKHFTVRPKSDKEWMEYPDMVTEEDGITIDGFALFEGAGELINDETGEVVGISVNESADIRVMKNGPFDVNQK